MKISYKKLWIMLAEQEMTKQEFREKLQIASGTMTKLNKGQEVSMSIILRICEYFNCNIGDICDVFWRTFFMFTQFCCIRSKTI